MNIFFLDYNPRTCAQYMVDSHVSKMILETAQLLCTAHRLSGSTEEALYQATHISHPSAIWARKSQDNYRWLAHHYDALAREFSHRFGGREHKSYTQLVDLIWDPPSCLPDGMFTVPKPAMDPEYLVGDPSDGWPFVVLSYRNYYKLGKTHLHKWTNRVRPEWM